MKYPRTEGEQLTSYHVITGATAGDPDHQTRSNEEPATNEKIKEAKSNF